MNWKWIFEKGMFWILILIFFIGNYSSGLEPRGVNKTVGWTFDQSNQWIINGYIFFGSWLIFIIGYGIVTLMRKKTDLNLSIAHVSIFILTLIIGIVTDFFGIGILIISLISITVFGLNIYRTFKNESMKQNNLLLILLLLVISYSCKHEDKKQLNIDNIKKEEVYGIWSLSDKSNNSKNNTTLITKFDLNPDASVIVHYKNDKTTGNWKWKAVKKMGNNNFGLEVTSDVVISTNSDNKNFYLGLRLITEDGKLCLSDSKNNLYIKK